MVILRLPAILIVLAVAIAVTPLRAQDRELPYWAAMRFDEVNMRVGPSGEYKIDWVYRRKGLPVRVVRMREGWRLIEDHEGTQGWVNSSQLTASRSVMVVGEGVVDIRESAASNSKMLWRAEPGVVGDLIGCSDGWCEVDVTGRVGWIAQDRLWGAGEP